MKNLNELSCPPNMGYGIGKSVVDNLTVKAVRPLTLLQLANVSTASSQFADAVLLLIDPQLEYVTGRLPLTGITAAVEEAARLLEVARERSAGVSRASPCTGGLAGI